MDETRMSVPSYKGNGSNNPVAGLIQISVSGAVNGQVFRADQAKPVGIGFRAFILDGSYRYFPLHIQKVDLIVVFYPEKAVGYKFLMGNFLLGSNMRLPEGSITVKYQEDCSFLIFSTQ